MNHRNKLGIVQGPKDFAEFSSLDIYLRGIPINQNWMGLLNEIRFSPETCPSFVESFHEIPTKHIVTVHPGSDRTLRKFVILDGTERDFGKFFQIPKDFQGGVFVASKNGDKILAGLFLQRGSHVLSNKGESAVYPFLVQPERLSGLNPIRWDRVETS
jgi:hypothetical protein